MTSLDALQSRLGYRFREPSLLLLALTHPSVTHEQGGGQAHNQRLEYLGDAVLQLALSREIYDRYPNHNEGPLTKLRSQLVNQGSLTEQGRRLGLGTHLVLSRGEQISGGRERPSILADAYEALLGAIFLDGGFEAARTFILDCFQTQFAELAEVSTRDNPKGALQEILQAFSAESPQYHVTSASGPDHDRSFECAVTHQGKELGRGKGKSKKTAESQAAVVALERMKAGDATGQPAPTT